MRKRSPERKLIVAVVQRNDADGLLEALTGAGYGSLVLSTTGGFLRRGNATVLTITSGEVVESVIALIRDHCSERTELSDPGLSVQVTEWQVPHSMPIQTGGASIWVLSADLALFPSEVNSRSRPRKD